jgi:uncharacterized protein YjbI with pentapeptide repeats
MGHGEILDFSGRDLTFVDLSGHNLEHASLRGAILALAEITKTNLAHADLREVDLSKATLRNCNLSLAKMGRAELAEARLQDIDARGTRLEQANLSHARLENVSFKAASLADASLSHATIERSILYNVNATGLQGRACTFTAGTTIDATRFTYARLEDTVFRNSRILECSFDEAYLQRMLIQGSQLEDNSFVRTHGEGMRFVSVIGRANDFTEADLRNAVIEKCSPRLSFDGANLTGVARFERMPTKLERFTRQFSMLQEG